MEDDFSIDFGELNKLPDFDLDDEVSFKTNYSEKISEILCDDPNLDKIFEYLNNDIEEQQELIDKLLEIEKKIDEYLAKTV